MEDIIYKAHMREFKMYCRVLQELIPFFFSNFLFPERCIEQIACITALKKLRVSRHRYFGLCGIEAINCW